MLPRTDETAPDSGGQVHVSTKQPSPQPNRTRDPCCGVTRWAWEGSGQCVLCWEQLQNFELQED